jgi:hypothetical protein
MNVRDAILANDELAKIGSDRAKRRRNALMRYARERGVTVRDLADLLHINPTTSWTWSGGPLIGHGHALDDTAPESLCPPPDIAVPIPGQESFA